VRIIYSNKYHHHKSKSNQIFSRTQRSITPHLERSWQGAVHICRSIYAETRHFGKQNDRGHFCANIFLLLNHLAHIFIWHTEWVDTLQKIIISNI